MRSQEGGCSGFSAFTGFGLSATNFNATALEKAEERFSAFTGFGLSATPEPVACLGHGESEQVSVPSQALASLLLAVVVAIVLTMARFQCLHRLWPLCYPSWIVEALEKGWDCFSAFTGFGLSATRIYDCLVWRGACTSFSAFTGFGLSATYVPFRSGNIGPHGVVSVPSQALASLLRRGPGGNHLGVQKFQCLHRLWPLCYVIGTVRPDADSVTFQCLHRLWPLCYQIKKNELPRLSPHFVSVPSQALASLLQRAAGGRCPPGSGFQCLHRLWPLCYFFEAYLGVAQEFNSFSAFTGFGLSATGS